ncbi:hypothetical protein LTR04_006587 [Oleoguttula sp. CCFEE 6159]|nr:hypothetical protein LTR04_006587 [Oleoguttula sp. CCFEE 6159]
MSTGAIANMPSTTATSGNMGTEFKPTGDAATKVKPCCVCKDEKAARDECMLFSNSSNPQAECEDMVSRYRSCMRGYGFSLP